jgi:hypothetical protein
MTDIMEIDASGSGAPPVIRPMTPEEQAGYDAIVATGEAQVRSVRFGVDADAERLALVSERAQVDPAFAALADLTLGKQGV